VGNATPRVICCDTCPMSPTCEEENQFLADIGLGEPWGDDGYPEGPGYCVTPGCDCCDDPADAVERHFLGDLGNWKPTGLLPGLTGPSQPEEP
jgi:hypothetical protein